MLAVRCTQNARGKHFQRLRLGVQFVQSLIEAGAKCQNIRGKMEGLLMSFSEWGTFREMESLTTDSNDLLGNFPLINRYATPRTDVYQTDREIIVKSEVPGLAREDMEVLVEDTYIRLSGQKRRIKTRDNEEIYRSEQFYGSFSRIIPLPAEVQPDMAVAEYKDGILSIVIPKSDNKSPRGKKVVIT